MIKPLLNPKSSHGCLSIATVTVRTYEGTESGKRNQHHQQPASEDRRKPVLRRFLQELGRSKKGVITTEREKVGVEGTGRRLERETVMAE